MSLQWTFESKLNFKIVYKKFVAKEYYTLERVESYKNISLYLTRRILKYWIKEPGNFSKFKEKLKDLLEISDLHTDIKLQGNMRKQLSYFKWTLLYHGMFSFSIILQMFQIHISLFQRQVSHNELM